MRHHATIAVLCLVATCGFSTTTLADAISVPEPSSMSLFGAAAIGLVLIARTIKLASR
jgi:PEP-CTERM motif